MIGIKKVKRIFWMLANKACLSNRIYFLRNKPRLSAWREKDFIFIHIPKNAGTSICKALGMPDPGHFSYELLLSAGALSNKKIIFCVIRDPVSRVISIYNYCVYMHKKNGENPLSWIAKYPSLEDFISSGLTFDTINKFYFLWPQSKYVGAGNDPRIQYINFLEIDNGFKNVSKNFGCSTSLPVSNSRPKTDTYISDNCIEKIKFIYQSDYQLIENIKYI